MYGNFFVIDQIVEAVRYLLQAVDLALKLFVPLDELGSFDGDLQEAALGKNVGRPFKLGLLGLTLNQASKSKLQSDSHLLTLLSKVHFVRNQIYEVNKSLILLQNNVLRVRIFQTNDLSIVIFLYFECH